MPEGPESMEPNEPHELAVRPRVRGKPLLFRTLDLYLQAALAWLFQILLYTFTDLQDAILAIAVVRRLVVYALMPRCQQTIARSLHKPEDLKSSFSELTYHVPVSAQELLLHAGLHTLVMPAVTGAGSSPSIGRILLQTGTENSGKYQEAVAGALAKELRASLLIVDDRLLRQVAVDALTSDGSRAEESGITAYLLSFWLSGGKVAFVWEVLNRICMSPGTPLVVLVRDVEHTVCSNFESYDAFVRSFGSLSKSALQSQPVSRSQRSFVLMGGTSLSEKGADRTPPTIRSLLERAAQDKGKPGFGDGAEDAVSSLFPELSLALQEDRPEPRKLLEKLFMTVVKLEAPMTSAAAEQHKNQLAEDARTLTAEHNLRELEQLQLCKASLPLPSSEFLMKKQLSRKEWSKVLMWAKSMDSIRMVVKAVNQVKDLDKDEDAFSSFLETGSLPLKKLRRSASVMESEGISLENGEDNLARAKKKLKKLPAPSKSPSRETSSASSADEGLIVSQSALQYGLRMLEKSGTGLQPSIKAANAYERNLLQEVVRPEESGTGFAEVGALSEAKDALREVVQLPLQHPQLFASASLARLSKGVLLFGPPGTGKTMLARAVAAECGASFLAIHPSAVASKWLGDGVRYVQAVFSLARKMAPCVVFFDEVDALLSRRNSHGEHESLREMKNEAMAQWDGIRTSSSNTRERVVVLGATNRPMDLDEAVLRRFSRRIFCDMPNKKAREAILKVILADERLAEDVDLGSIASRTDGYSGSDLRQVCTAAAMRPVRDLLKATGKSAQNGKEHRTKKLLASSEEDKSSPESEASDGHVNHDLEPPANGHKDGRSAADREPSPAESFSSCNGNHHFSETEASPTEVIDTNVSLPSVSPEAQSREAEKDPEKVEPSTKESLPDLPLIRTTGGSALSSEKASLAKEAQRLVLQSALEDLKDRAKQMEDLLADCNRMAADSTKKTNAELRPINAQDFTEAIKQTAPSTDESSYAMDDLKIWNSKYGEGSKSYLSPKLSYFN